jgi:signal transduction histidine kinase
MNKPFIVLLPEGKRKVVNISIQAVGEAESVTFVHAFQDCADLRSMEERLLQSERLATIGRFASQIAHEIRNPLSSISLNVELLEDELKDTGEEARSLIYSVLKELDRLNDIVSEYLQFSRFPKPQLKRGRIDGVIEDLVRHVKLPPNVRIETELMAASPEVSIDEALLRQVLDNLVRNGVEAIQGPGVIRIETEVIDRFLVIRVRDSGSGISADAQSRLFQPFFTTKPHGTGLGLATSQQIIFEHNGHLTADSQEGKGATFTTFIPL